MLKKTTATRPPISLEMVELIHAIEQSFRGYKGGVEMDAAHPQANIVDGLMEIANALYSVAAAFTQAQAQASLQLISGTAGPRWRARVRLPRVVRR